MDQSIRIERTIESVGGNEPNHSGSMSISLDINYQKPYAPPFTGISTSSTPKYDHVPKTPCTDDREI
jgi:hypothetical protein